MATFGKELPTRLTLCSLCIMPICKVNSRFSFEGGIWVLIAPVPVHRLLVALNRLELDFNRSSLISSDSISIYFEESK